jgi:hypothetical protein
LIRQVADFLEQTPDEVRRQPLGAEGEEGGPAAGRGTLHVAHRSERAFHVADDVRPRGQVVERPRRRDHRSRPADEQLRDQEVAGPDQCFEAQVGPQLEVPVEDPAVQLADSLRGVRRRLA